jgi:hypothetical protein
VTLLVTLDEAKSHLRVDHGLDDDDITLKIEAASAAVLEYIGDTQYLFLDTGGDDLDLADTSADQVGLRARHKAKQATLLLVGDWFTNRTPNPADVVDQRFGYGYLPRAVVALLYGLRDPTIA